MRDRMPDSNGGAPFRAPSPTEPSAAAAACYCALIPRVSLSLRPCFLLAQIRKARNNTLGLRLSVKCRVRIQVMGDERIIQCEGS